MIQRSPPDDRASSGTSTVRGPRRPSLTREMLVAVTVVYLVAAAALVLFVRQEVRANALAEAADKAEIILARNYAIHRYFSTQLKPTVFKLAEEARPPSYFDPVWMSSTYAVREIDRIYREESKAQPYYYKEAAVNARDPANEADAYERSVLLRMRADKTLKRVIALRTIDGKPYFVVLYRGESMEETCMRCHGTPDRAPADLVETYGPTRSFGRSPGLAEALSIRIPLAQAYAQADAATLRISGILLAALLACIGVLYVWLQRTVLRPVRTLRDAAADLADGSAHLGTAVSVPPGREFGELAESFNTMSARLRATVENLEEVSSAKSAFLAAMSHELRTPLNSIIGFSSLLARGQAGALNDEQQRQIGMIKNSGHLLLAIVSDVLDLSSIESGAVQPEMSEADLMEVTRSCVDSVRGLAEVKGLRIDVASPEGGQPLRIVTDQRLVRQILLNLLSNAVRFTDEGSIEVAVVPDVASLRIAVADTGCGIPADAVEPIFDDYRQAPRTGYAKTQGTGLGLSIARRLAALIGGRLEVESEVGAGSTFTLVLPVEPPRAESA